MNLVIGFGNATHSVFPSDLTYTEYDPALDVHHLLAHLPCTLLHRNDTDRTHNEVEQSNDIILLVFGIIVNERHDGTLHTCNWKLIGFGIQV